MGKHGHFKNKNKRVKGTGTRGNAGPFSLAAAQKMYDEMDAKTQKGYTRPGSEHKYPYTVQTQNGPRRRVHG